MRIVQVASGGGGVAEDYILIRDEKVSGTDGGTFTSGAWRTRTLNTLVVNLGGFASLAANQITLAAGTYRVKSRAPAYQVDPHKIRLRNITDSVNTVIGSTEMCSSAHPVGNRSFLDGRFIIASSKVFELQHRCITTKVTTGFGFSSGFGDIEVYSVIEFWKE